MATTTRRDPTQTDVDEASSTLRACIDRDLLAEICHGDGSSTGNRRASTPSSLASASSPPWKGTLWCVIAIFVGWGALWMLSFFRSGPHFMSYVCDAPCTPWFATF